MPFPAIYYRTNIGKSKPLPENTKTAGGYDFNQGVDYHKILNSYKTVGFQATNFGKAVDEINKMIRKKMEPISEENRIKEEANPIKKERGNCTIFLGYTSNMISSGIRETLRFLAQHNLIDCIVVTCGGVEEDFMKCMAPFYMGELRTDDKKLRKNRINRIHDLYVPNDHYDQFEKWLMPILDQMLIEQNEQGAKWTPSKLIWRLGKEIDNPESVYYWAYKNQIPVFSPAITDGAIGDVLYYQSFENPGLNIDIVEDIKLLNMQALYAANSGLVILGGGLVKHHICNANLMRDGADYSVFINTAQEYDGSDAGAPPTEAVSWGKIKSEATPVKLCCEATLVFPLIVAETFARQHLSISENGNGNGH